MLILGKDKKLGKCPHGQITFGNNAFCNILYFLVIFGSQPHLNKILYLIMISFLLKKQAPVGIPSITLYYDTKIRL